MKRILFVCIHNSARSQMAEAWLNALAPSDFQAESAGIEKGTLNLLVVAAMQESGIDISRNTTNEVADFLSQGRIYDAVITVCDAANAERCPTFPGKVKRIAWSFPDPSALAGTTEEKMEQIRIVRNEIKTKVASFIEMASHTDYWKD